jgi:hypothetical protein
MEGVLDDVSQALGRRHVIAETSYRIRGASWTTLAMVSPYAQQTHKEITVEFHIQNL